MIISSKEITRLWLSSLVSALTGKRSESLFMNRTERQANELDFDDTADDFNAVLHNVLYDSNQDLAKKGA